ncbi:MAG: ABC transporter ATP-binding protein [Nitrospirae bacterium]|nr:ABC transporter ATP-binding protein [Nitrospirota bacterium]
MTESKYTIIWYFLRAYKPLYGGVLVVTVLGALLESVNLAAFFPVFQSLLNPSSSGDGGKILGIARGVGRLLPFQDPVIVASIVLVAVMLMKSAVALLREGLVAKASGRVLYDVKNRLLGTYAASSYQFFLDNKQGALVYNFIAAPHKVSLLLLKVPQLLADLFKVVAIAAVLLVVLPVAALVLAIAAGVYYLGTHYVSTRVSYHTGKARATASAEQATIANEFLNGIRQIMAVGTRRFWLARFEQENRTFCQLYVKDLVWLAMPKYLMETTAVLLLLGLMLVAKGSGSGDLAAHLPVMGVFAMAVFQLLPSLTSFGRQRMEMMGALADSERVYLALTETTPRPKEGVRVLDTFRNAIVFEHVSFAHQGREPLLKQVNLRFEKGQAIAICGPSGAGKTTLVNLLLGLFEPSEGRITVDGVPLADYTTESWLSKIGLVSQEPFIFHSTIADNILFGRHGDYTRDDLMQAAMTANAHAFIEELPDGYDTIVGERGMKLSGGQQQRIAIARALLGRPEILIFDEATSSLDTISERLVQDAIEAISKDHTTIVIAHRLSTIASAQKIVVLETGRVVEEGCHGELLEIGGQYSRMIAAGLGSTH